jgi:hypothetical protein
MSFAGKILMGEEWEQFLIIALKGKKESASSATQTALQECIDGDLIAILIAHQNQAGLIKGCSADDTSMVVVQDTAGYSEIPSMTVG